MKMKITPEAAAVQPKVYVLDESPRPQPTTRPELTFDGHGINGPDEYRSRLATFTLGADVNKYGPLLAAAPDLVRLLKDCVGFIEQSMTEAQTLEHMLDGHDPEGCILCESRQTIAQVEGRQP